jgi:hypothetical protein
VTYYAVAQETVPAPSNGTNSTNATGATNSTGSSKSAGSSTSADLVALTTIAGLAIVFCFGLSL